MRTFSLTEAAKADLKSIAAYTQRRWGKEQRRVHAKQFDDAFHMLADTLEAGIPCDVIKVGYRKFPIGSHVIFYHPLSETDIEIVRILHKRMDLPRRLDCT
ncbi:type II toxin-antitoxin system RelE/ParE family toxin [Chromatocurvus halotolerans]|uniref:type II toxin-antitoxin system RelE/ParE family toxin n=1 Tax=Chromatocurvus halotolerans TaxID=1132028 RepID=UPI000E3E6927|nr:type II toxin-antitoxin system RelE/ParE family toxin [Chromatocurvus halotolerans]